MIARKKTAATLAAFLGLSGLSAGFAVLPASAQAPGPLRAGRGVARPLGARGERHPAIQAALRNLEKAKDNLQRAKHDFSGHREQALDLVQKAIEQCQQAIQSDKQ